MSAEDELNPRSSLDLPDEEWAPVKGYEGMYEVSNYCRVRSLDRDVEKSDGTVRRVYGRLLSVNRSSEDNCWAVWLSNENQTFHTSAARLAYAAFLGPVPDHMKVIRCDGERIGRLARVEMLELVDATVLCRSVCVRINKSRRDADAQQPAG